VSWRDAKVGLPDIIPKTDDLGEAKVKPLNAKQQKMARDPAFAWYRAWLLTTYREEDA
jgi:hypothetical protein